MMSTKAVLPSMSALDRKFNAVNDELSDLFARQAGGEEVDGDEFVRLLEMSTVTHQAMEVKTKLSVWPLKTVLGDTH